MPRLAGVARAAVKKYALGLLLISIVALLPFMTIAHADYYIAYAGYYYYDTEGWPPPYGVSGNILTIDKTGTRDYEYTEWVTVILSYQPLYWIQVGYLKSTIRTNGQLAFYVEIKDQNGYHLEIIPPPSPTPGVYYQYWISKNPSTGAWSVGATGRFSYSIGVRSPNDARDYQAFAEVHYYPVNLDGTHFKDLMYKISSYDWWLWDTHIAHADNPYKVIEVSDHEFEVEGGG